MSHAGWSLLWIGALVVLVAAPTGLGAAAGPTVTAGPPRVLLTSERPAPPAAPRAATSQLDWVNVSARSLSSAPSAGLIAYDAADGYDVELGGCTISPGCWDTTYIYSNYNWTNITSSAGTPPPGEVIGNGWDTGFMTYDAADGYVLLFLGAVLEARGSIPFAQTWKFEAGQWTNLTSSISQEPNTGLGGVLAYDPAEGYVVLFGGTGSPASTWSYLAGTWTDLTPTAGEPSPVTGGTMAYDASLGGIVLDADPGTGAQPASWEFRGGVWFQLNPASDFADATGGALGFDPQLGQFLMYGGMTDSGDLTTLWNFTGENWSVVVTSHWPNARETATLLWDASLRTMLLWGGADIEFEGPVNSVWALVLRNSTPPAHAAWTLLQGGGALGGEVGEELAYDAADAEFVLYGGGGSSSYDQNDTWLYDPSLSTWTQLSLSGAPGDRQNFAMAYDPAEAGIVVFGGYGCSFGGACNGADLNDTWLFRSGTWTDITSQVGPAPPVRNGAAMTYDPQFGGLVLFSGIGWAYGGYLLDTWVLQNGRWMNITVQLGTPPPGRWGASFAYDAADNEAILFGGQNTSANSSNDTWALRGGASPSWTPVRPAVSPAVRHEASAAYDPWLGTMVLFGGGGCLPPCSTAFTDNDTWEFSQGSWTNETANSTLTPPASYQGAMAADPQTGGLVLVTESDQTWGYGTGPAAGTLKVQASSSPGLANVGIPESFNGTASGGVAPYSWSWNFGDGSPNSTVRNPVHTYTTAGTFWVDATVTDALLQVANVSLYLQVFEGTPLTATISATPTSGVAPLTVSFTLTATGGLPGYTYDWTFDDGGGSMYADPTHTYNGSGTWGAWVTVHDSSGAYVNSNTLDITVAAALTVSATASPSGGFAPLTVSFTATPAGGTGTYSEYRWAFGDGSWSNGTDLPSVQHTYASSGTYSAVVTVADSSGSQASSSPLAISVSATPPPLAVLVSANRTSATVGMPVNFSASATGGESPYAYAWRFGDGGASFSNPAIHAFLSPGTFYVWAWANDSSEQTASGVVQLTITAVPTPPAKPHSSSGPAGLTAGQTDTLLVVVPVALLLIVAVAFWGRSRQRSRIWGTGMVAEEGPEGTNPKLDPYRTYRTPGGGESSPSPPALANKGNAPPNPPREKEDDSLDSMA